MQRPSRAARTISSGAGGVRVLDEVGFAGNASEDMIDEVLTASALDEIRQLKHPPLAVRQTLEVIHLVLNAHRHRHGIPQEGVKWESVLRTITAEGLIQRLQTFDIAELQQTPCLTRDLRDRYFQPAKPVAVTGVGNVLLGPQPLSPERVRHASKSACTLFSWAARAVEAATPLVPTVASTIATAPENAVDEPVLTAASPSPPEQEQEFEDEDPITIGIWATCPGGHGLDISASVSSFTCAICSTSISSGWDTASCRQCGFFVCVDCRRGSWLAARVSSMPAETCQEQVIRRADIIGFRWLRSGDAFPEPLSLQSTLEQGSAACWGRSGAAILGEVCVTVWPEPTRPEFAGCSGSVATRIQGSVPRFARTGNRGSVFNLVDQRALSAAVLMCFSGFPGAR